MDQNPQTSAEIVSNLRNFVFLGSRIITDFADANLVIPFLYNYVALFLGRVEPVKPIGVNLRKNLGYCEHL